MPCFRWLEVGRVWPDGGVCKQPTRAQALAVLAQLYPGATFEIVEISEAEADASVAGRGEWLAGGPDQLPPRRVDES